MDIRDDLRLRDIEQVVIALEFGWMILEVPAEGGFVELECLDHRPHRSIENGDAGPKQPLDFLLRVPAFCHAS